jgi:hypothetical protein
LAEIAKIAGYQSEIVRSLRNILGYWSVMVG